MKKLSIVLALVLLFTSAFGVGAAAAEADENTVLRGAKLEEAVAAVVREFTGADDGASVTFHDDIADVLDENGNGIVTAGEAASGLATYLFADADTLGDAAARIADEAQYRVTVLEDGRTTVYVFVDIKNNPALFNLEVFSDAVTLMLEKQAEAVAGTENVTLLTYEQMAGELALHEILYVITDTLGGDAEGSFLHGYYEQAQEAALNIDETRVPSWIINFFGTILALLQRILAVL